MKRFIPALFMFMLILQACGGSSQTVTTEEAVVDIATEPQPVATEEPAAATEAPATEALATEAPVSIVHTVIPQGGTTERVYAHDNENITTFENKDVRFGDEFEKNRFERPFTSNDMEYLPDLDILDYGITSDDQFFYISIVLTGLAPDETSPTGFYGVEIDRDSDGRADLMLATVPSYSTEFTAENVIVLADMDGDIGGPTINRPDANFTGNGYDGIIFDLSQNIFPKDPDLAWVRYVEGGRPSIEIAYRKWIFRGGNEQFMWSAFSLGASEVFDPSKFTTHDNITAVDAGSPIKTDPNYPIKKLAAMDNTCRIAFGFQATGFEPFGCIVTGPDVAAVGKDDDGGGNNGNAGNSGGGGGGGGNGNEEIPSFCDGLPEVCNRQVPEEVPQDFVIRGQGD